MTTKKNKPTPADIATARERLSSLETLKVVVCLVERFNILISDLNILLFDHARIAGEVERVRNIVDAQDSTEDTPTLVEREIKSLEEANHKLRVHVRHSQRCIDFEGQCICGAESVMKEANRG